jgi:hypothetical protein
MHLSISNEIISDLITGLTALFILVLLGCILSIVLGRMKKQFPFTRLTLILALPPLSMIRFLDPVGVSALCICVVVLMLLGITIDGIKHLRQSDDEKQESDHRKNKKESASKEADPNVIVWEKLE